MGLPIVDFHISTDVHVMSYDDRSHAIVETRAANMQRDP
jgi:hypothetical protein